MASVAASSLRQIAFAWHGESVAVNQNTHEDETDYCHTEQGSLHARALSEKVARWLGGCASGERVLLGTSDLPVDESVTDLITRKNPEVLVLPMNNFMPPEAGSLRENDIAALDSSVYSELFMKGIEMPDDRQLRAKQGLGKMRISIKEYKATHSLVIGDLELVSRAAQLAIGGDVDEAELTRRLAQGDLVVVNF